jgi:hypothetical protein
LADVVLSVPVTAYQKADDIAERRGEAVDPSRSRRGGGRRLERLLEDVAMRRIGRTEPPLCFCGS